MKFEEFKRKYEKVRVEEYSNKMFQKPIVSVCVVTFQHVNFIKQCLDGILMQETNFDFEILLGDDASKDGTREICIEYAQKHPDKIKLFLHHRENNISIGGQPTGRFNFVYNLFSAKGKYIALCEGDDYWTDPKKLQKQVDFLENNQYFVMSFHDVVSVDKNSNKIDYRERNRKTLQPIDLLLGSVMPTASCLIRNEALKNVIIPEACKVFNGDTFFFAHLSRFGAAYYHENMLSAAYRKHEGGMWSNADFLFNLQESLNTKLYIYRTIGDKSGKVLLNKRIKKIYINLLKHQLLNLKLKSSFKSSWRYIIFLVKGS